jgi:hypothetical protein
MITVSVPGQVQPTEAGWGKDSTNLKRGLGSVTDTAGTDAAEAEAMKSDGFRLKLYDRKGNGDGAGTFPHVFAQGPDGEHNGTGSGGCSAFNGNGFGDAYGEFFERGDGNGDLSYGYGTGLFSGGTGGSYEN